MDKKRLIDANVLREAITTDYWEHFTRYHDTDQIALIDMVCEDIDNAPTVDAVEVVYGRWEVNTKNFTPAYRCSICGYNKPMIAGERVSQGSMNYCENCGADMRGNRNG